MKRLFVLVLMCIFMVSMVWATGKKDEAPVPAAKAGAKAGGTLVVAKVGEAPNLDPHFTSAVATKRVLDLIYSKLVFMNEKLVPQPDLAESWEALDSKTYVFHLRKGLKFHDGSPCTAEDVKFSYERLQQEGSVSRSNFLTIEKMEVLDATTLKVYLKTPNAGFLAILASDYGCIVSKKVVTEHGHLRDIAVGTGPFKLEKWENGIETVFAKNEYYYKAGRPYLDKIIYKIIPDEMSALAALKTKQVDLARVNDPKNVKLLDQAGIEILRTPENGYLYFCLNTNIKPFGDIKVRQAISMAIDRKEILRVVGQNDGVVLGVLSPGHAEFSVPFADLPYVKLDLAKAKQLLSEAGFAGGFSFECISLLPGDYPNAANATLMIQSQLKQIGIDMKVTQLELATFLNRIDKLQDAPAHLSINSGRADPDDQLYAFFHSTGGYNRAHIKDADLDKYLDLGRSTLDRAARIKAYRDFQFRLVELAPMFFLYSQNQLDAYRDYVKGFKQNAMYTYRYMEDVWVEK